INRFLRNVETKSDTIVYHIYTLTGLENLFSTYLERHHDEAANEDAKEEAKAPIRIRLLDEEYRGGSTQHKRKDGRMTSSANDAEGDQQLLFLPDRQEVAKRSIELKIMKILHSQSSIMKK